MWVPCVTVVLKYIPFLLRCPLFPCRKKSPILSLEKNILTNVRLFGSDKYDKVIIVDISKSPIVYLKSTKRFERPLIHHWSFFSVCLNACIFIAYSNFHLILKKSTKKASMMYLQHSAINGECEWRWMLVT